MTPKEKARDLVDKFMSYAYFSDGNNSMERAYQQEDNAKQCALIAVDEMLKTNWINVWEKDYWDEVKQEIEKL